MKIVVIGGTGLIGSKVVEKLKGGGHEGLSPEQAAAVRELERERIPLERRGDPDDVARWIVRLADPTSGWVTGQVIVVDGGLGLE